MSLMMKKMLLSIYGRTGCGNPAAGLDDARDCPGNVCQQPSQWAAHHDCPLPAEPLVGSEWSAGYPCVHSVCLVTGTKQVRWHLHESIITFSSSYIVWGGYSFFSFHTALSSQRVSHLCFMLTTSVTFTSGKSYQRVYMATMGPWWAF